MDVDDKKRMLKLRETLWSQSNALWAMGKRAKDRTARTHLGCAEGYVKKALASLANLQKHVKETNV